MSSRSNTRVPNSFDSHSTKEFLSNVIEIQFGDHRSKAKALAAHTAGEASHRTAETWVARKSLPSLPAFLNLLLGPKPLPALRAEVRRLLAEANDHQIGPDRAIHELERILALMKGER